MSPEVQQSCKELCGRRSDMWSFGVLVVRMVLKHEPFELMYLDDEAKAASAIQVGECVGRRPLTLRAFLTPACLV